MVKTFRELLEVLVVNKNLQPNFNISQENEIYLDKFKHLKFFKTKTHFYFKENDVIVFYLEIKRISNDTLFLGARYNQSNIPGLLRVSIDILLNTFTKIYEDNVHDNLSIKSIKKLINYSGFDMYLETSKWVEKIEDETDLDTKMSRKFDTNIYYTRNLVKENILNSWIKRYNYEDILEM